MILSSIVSLAHAQTVDDALQFAQNKGVENCMPVVITEGFYTPIRITMEYPQTTKPNIQIDSTDPESEVIYNGSPTLFNARTNSTDRHKILFSLDYDKEFNEPQFVKYFMYVQDNNLAQEGRWEIEGTSFCVVYDVWSAPAPHILTTEEIEETYNEANKERQSEIISMLELSLSWNGITTLIVIIAIIGLAVVLGFVIFDKNAWKKHANRTIQYLEKETKRTKSLNENLQISIHTNDRLNESMRKQLEEYARLFQMYAYDLKNAIGLKESFPTAKSLSNISLKEEPETVQPSGHRENKSTTIPLDDSAIPSFFENIKEKASIVGEKTKDLFFEKKDDKPVTKDYDYYFNYWKEKPRDDCIERYTELNVMLDTKDPDYSDTEYKALYDVIQNKKVW